MSANEYPAGYMPMTDDQIYDWFFDLTISGKRNVRQFERAVLARLPKQPENISDVLADMKTRLVLLKELRAKSEHPVIQQVTEDIIAMVARWIDCIEQPTTNNQEGGNTP